MARGRKPTPTHLKLITDNPGKRTLPHHEMSKARRLRSPIALTKTQQKFWRYSVKYAPHGLLQHIDAMMLAQYVIAQSIYDQAEKSLRDSPMLLKTPSGMAIQNPWLSILNRQAAIMTTLASELGFTPSSRARLGVFDSHEQGDGEADEYFND